LFGDSLPTYLTRFVGRSRELSRLDALVGSTRLVTICGMGGAGKSRLAVEFARGLNIDRTPGRFPDGAVWVPLLAVTDADELPNGVATALGIRGATGGRLIVAVQRALRDRRLLLVMDNCEHLASACSDLLDALLPVCPQVSVLATSRRALESDLEVVFELPALGVDRGGAGDAVALFIDRATITSPAYALTDADSEAVHDICSRLDGHPLAIELVASWIRVLSPRDLLATLGEGLTPRGSVEWQRCSLGCWTYRGIRRRRPRSGPAGALSTSPAGTPCSPTMSTSRLADSVNRWCCRRRSPTPRRPRPAACDRERATDVRRPRRRRTLSRARPRAEPRGG
jgi:hypothetical protein